MNHPLQVRTFQTNKLDFDFPLHSGSLPAEGQRYPTAVHMGLMEFSNLHYWNTCRMLNDRPMGDGRTYPKNTYVWFHLGWIFMAISVCFMIVGPLFISNHLIVVALVGSSMLLGGIALRLCVWAATHGSTTRKTH